MITSFIDNLPKKSEKTVIKSLIGSLNSSIIGYTRGHIRSSMFENISTRTDVPTIDDFNDAAAALAEAGMSNTMAIDAGLAPTVPPLEIAEKLGIIRNWFAARLIQVASTPYDIPLAINDTLDFQIKRAPNVNEPILKALAAAIEIDFEVLKASKLKIDADDKTELTNMRGQITTITDKFGGDEEDEVAIEAVFDSLPVQIQFKLMSTCCKALDKAEGQAIVDLLKYNRMDGAADSKLVKAVKFDVVAWLKTFSTQNAHELSEFVERGGQLPAIPA